MKIFEFNPHTGRRGEQISAKSRASWTSCSWKYACRTRQVEILKHEVKMPKAFGQDWTWHLDAGINGPKFEAISYRHETKWICFCLGKFTVGSDSTWQWVVLAPNSVTKLDLTEKVYEVGYSDHETGEQIILGRFTAKTSEEAAEMALKDVDSKTGVDYQWHGWSVLVGQ